MKPNNKFTETRAAHPPTVWIFLGTARKGSRLVKDGPPQPLSAMIIAGIHILGGFRQHFWRLPRLLFFNDFSDGCFSVSWWYG